MTNSVLIIGANGAIAKATISHLLNSSGDNLVYGVSRQKTTISNPDYQHSVLEDYSEHSIKTWCQNLADHSLNLVICTLGILHDNTFGIHPEKKIEDLDPAQLQHYFMINAITPALWLKHLLPKIQRKAASNIVLLSARVGSISDNGLGGWYGYRASKSALNMLVKTAQVEYQRRAPGCELILYHPGTVASHLSKPFQKNVKEDRLFSPEFTVQRLFDLLNNKPASAPPHFVDWNRQPIDW